MIPLILSEPKNTQHNRVERGFQFLSLLNQLLIFAKLFRDTRCKKTENSLEVNYHNSLKGNFTSLQITEAKPTDKLYTNPQSAVVIHVI